MLELIQQYAADEFAAGDDQGVLTILNAETVKKTNDRLVTLQIIEAEYGENIAEQVIVALQAAIIESPLTDGFYIRLGSVGIDVSTPQSQAAIDRVTALGKWSASIGTGFKKLGIWYTSPAQDSIERDLTLEDITQARAVDTLGTVIDRANEAVAAASNAVDTGGTPEEIIAAAEAAWGN